MFCKNCGKEVSDKAFACPNCGCLVREVAYTVAQLPMAAPETEAEKAARLEKEKKERIASTERKAKLFSILAFAFLCATVFGLCGQLSDYLGYISGQWTYYDGGAMVIAMIFSWAALGMGITAFVFGRKIKEQNPALRVITCFVFMAGITFTVIPFMFL